MWFIPLCFVLLYQPFGFGNINIFSKQQQGECLKVKMLVPHIFLQPKSEYVKQSDVTLAWFESGSEKLFTQASLEMVSVPNASSSAHRSGQEWNINGPRPWSLLCSRASGFTALDCSVPDSLRCIWGLETLQPPSFPPKSSPLSLWCSGSFCGVQWIAAAENLSLLCAADHRWPQTKTPKLWGGAEL